LLLFTLIASFCHFFGAFVVLDSAEMSAALIIISKGTKYWKKMMQNGREKQMFGTVLNLALVLLLVQS